MILIVCGLKAEADIAAGDDITVVCGGGDQARLAADLMRLAPNATAIVSFGVAGGLDPSLTPGALAVAAGVVTANGVRYPCDPGWASRLATRLAAPTADFAAVDMPIADVAG